MHIPSKTILYLDKANPAYLCNAPPITVNHGSPLLLFEWATLWVSIDNHSHLIPVNKLSKTRTTHHRTPLIQPLGHKAHPHLSSLRRGRGPKRQHLHQQNLFHPPPCHCNSRAPLTNLPLSYHLTPFSISTTLGHLSPKLYFREEKNPANPTQRAARHLPVYLGCAHTSQM